MRLLESVLAKLPKTNKPQLLFIFALLELMLMVPGPITFRNLSRYSGYHEKTFARAAGGRRVIGTAPIFPLQL